jgi:hypothetical protein
MEIIGPVYHWVYPQFSKQKSSADQRRAGTQKVLDPAFAITTSVFQSSCNR